MDDVNGSSSPNTNDTAGQCFHPVLSYGDINIEFKVTIDILVAIFAIFGLVGNVLSFWILGHMKGINTSFLLRSLAVADMCYLVNCLIIQTCKTLYVTWQWFWGTFKWFPYLEVVAWPIACTSHTVGVWLTVVVTIDRFCAICMPLHGKILIPLRYAKIAVAMVVFLSVIFNLPTWFDMVVKDRRPLCPNITNVEVFYTPLLINPKYQLFYKTILCLLVRTAAPLVILVILNVRLLVAVHRSNKYNARHTRDDRSNNIDKVVISVVTVFILSGLPDLAFRVVRTIKLYHPTAPITLEHLLYLGTVSNFLLTVNSSVNFIIYCVSGQRFRMLFLQNLCGRSRKTEQTAVRYSAPYTAASVSEECGDQQTAVPSV